MNDIQAKGKDTAFANDQENETMKDENATADDVRKALASIIDNATMHPFGDDLDRAVDALVSSDRIEVRPRGPVTDVEYQAAWDRWHRLVSGGLVSDGYALRAALEAARQVHP